MSASHYDKEYFAWQSSIGAFGGRANIIKFESFVTITDDVVDFGCGGGYLLKNLECKHKVGIEINEIARKAAIDQGLHVVASAEAIDQDWADLIVSNHALEHCRHPLLELEALHRILRPGGRMVFVVPCESILGRYNPDDPNHHLYTWNPTCLGNLFSEAGFYVEECEPFFHQWPPNYARLAKLSWRLFHFRARVYGFFHRKVSQVRVVASKLA